MASSRSITALLCPLLLHPQEGAKVSFLFVTATTFLTILVRLTRPKAHVTHLHSSHSLTTVGLI